MAVSYKTSIYDGKLGMTERFKSGIKGMTATSYFQEVAATNGGYVRMKGGQAPSAYTSERGAAGAFNRVFLDRAERGVTWAELAIIAERTCLGKGSVKGDAVQRVIDHIRSFYLQADERRATANGLKQAVKANGWDWTEVQSKAVLIDGKAWNGNAIKRCVLPSSIIVPIVMLCVNFQRTASLEKALGLGKAEEEE